MRYCLRFKVTLALELLKDQLQGDKFGPLINLITSYLLQNPGGSELRWKVIGNKPDQFLVVVISAQDFSELQRIDEHFGTGKALWADASSDDSTFDHFKYGQPDSKFSFVNFETLQAQLERRDNITNRINGLFRILMAKEITKLPTDIYHSALATACEAASQAYKQKIVVGTKEQIADAIERLGSEDKRAIRSIRDHLAHLSLDLDQLLGRCEQTLVCLRQFPFTHEANVEELLKAYDQEALKPTE